MYLIIDDLKEMIKMQGGDTAGIRDIGMAVKTLKKLMVQNQAKKETPQPHHQSYQSRHEDRRKERHIESTEEA